MKSALKSWLARWISPAAFSRGVDFYVAGKNFIPALWLRGDRFACPLCSGKFRRMRTTGRDFTVLAEKQVVGGGRRLDSGCPRCGSSDRERLVFLFLQRKTDMFQRRFRLLHVAPERSLQRFLLRQRDLEYFSVDLDSPRAQKKMDITRIDYAEGFFDGVICCHVLEHVADDRLALRQLYRVLKPGGWAILQVPISLQAEATDEDPAARDPRERERRFGQRDHVRLYGRDYPERLADAGFAVSEYRFAGEFGETLAERYALCRDEVLFLCRKSGPRTPA